MELTGLAQGLFWLLAALAPLIVVQRALHREIQSVFLLLTRRADIAIMLFSLLFFPGILLHEGSHFLMARLLGVTTGRFSLIPRPVGEGRVQLGYVETARSDPLRETLIGMAPLITGGLFVAYAGLARLGLLDFWQLYGFDGPQTVWAVLRYAAEQPDFWLWFYLVLAVSSTMMPSASDRQAWLPLTALVGILIALAILAGAGPWMLTHLALPLYLGMLAVAMVFAFCILVHLLFWFPAWALRRLLSWATGLEPI